MEAAFARCVIAARLAAPPSPVADGAEKSLTVLFILVYLFI